MSASKQIVNTIIDRGSVSDAAELAEFAARTFEEKFSADNNPEDLQTHLSTNYGFQQQSAEQLLAATFGALLQYDRETGEVVVVSKLLVAGKYPRLFDRT